MNYGSNMEKFSSARRQKLLQYAGLQFISNCTDRFTHLESVEAALAGGCKWIQLRMKDVSDNEFVETAKKVREVCTANGAVFIIDDRVELVGETGADGVHLGLNDMPVGEARRILGSNSIIGGTANSFQDVVRHFNDGADYIGCGPFRFTTTKKNLSPILGIGGYRKILALMEENEISLPLIAIGGITLEELPELLGSGVSGIALSGAITGSANPSAAMELFVGKLRDYGISAGTII